MSNLPRRWSGRARRVVLDANVLVPNALRDTLLRAAEAGWYDPFWSATTLVEVERALLARVLRDHPERFERVTHLISAIRTAFPAATVTEDEALAAALANHPGDRHVLAVAVQGDAATIVTRNLRHFPPAALRPYRVAARSPDDFLSRLFAQDPTGMVDLLTAQGAELRQPRTLALILGTLSQHAEGFVRLVQEHLAHALDDSGE